MILTILAVIGAAAVTVFCAVVVWAAYILRQLGWLFEGDVP